MSDEQATSELEKQLSALATVEVPPSLAGDVIERLRSDRLSSPWRSRIWSLAGSAAVLAVGLIVAWITLKSLPGPTVTNRPSTAGVGGSPDPTATSSTTYVPSTTPSAPSPTPTAIAQSSPPPVAGHLSVAVDGLQGLSRRFGATGVWTGAELIL